jgi:NAD(P)H-flavin reductase
MDTLSLEPDVARVAPVLLPEPFRVERLGRDTADTWTLHVTPLDARRACAFEAGQFNMLYVFGLGEVPISISGDPTRRGPFVHTVRAVGAVTRALCSLRRGATLGLRGPFGHGWPLREAEGRDVVVVAGGIGLAPLRPAVLELLAGRKRFGRVSVLIGARSPADLLYARQVRGWARRAGVDVRVTVDAAPRDWRGDVGVVTNLLPSARFDPQTAVAFTCGPEVMMRYVTQQLLERGVAPERVWLSMERNMKCAVGVCGHCQWGAAFLCKDGPVLRADRIAGLLGRREL